MPIESAALTPHIATTFTEVSQVTKILYFAETYFDHNFKRNLFRVTGKNAKYCTLVAGFAENASTVSKATIIITCISQFVN